MNRKYIAYLLFFLLYALYVSVILFFILSLLTYSLIDKIIYDLFIYLFILVFLVFVVKKRIRNFLISLFEDQGFTIRKLFFVDYFFIRNMFLTTHANVSDVQARYIARIKNIQKINPDIISILGLIIGLLGCYFYILGLRIGAILIFSSFILDFYDGLIARLSPKRDLNRGAKIDLFCDNGIDFGVLIVFIINNHFLSKIMIGTYVFNLVVSYLRLNYSKEAVYKMAISPLRHVLIFLIILPMPLVSIELFGFLIVSKTGISQTIYLFLVIMNLCLPIASLIRLVILKVVDNISKFTQDHPRKL